MAQELYSVEQIAKLLDLHVKTVRGYVREGRLKAVRIGKQYRIAREDLEKLTGRPAAALEPAPVPRYRHVDVSSIVEADAVSPETAKRLMKVLMGVAASRPAGGEQLQVKTIYNEERAHLKVILVSGLDNTASLFKLIAAVLES